MKTLILKQIMTFLVIKNANHSSLPSLNHTVATGSGFSSTSFTTSLLLSATLDLNRLLLKKSGLSKVVNFLGIGRGRPDFLKRIRTTTVTMTVAITTSPTVKITWPWVGGSTLGLTVQIQNVDDEPEQNKFDLS